MNISCHCIVDFIGGPGKHRFWLMELKVRAFLVSISKGIYSDSLPGKLKLYLDNIQSIFCHEFQ